MRAPQCFAKSCIMDKTSSLLSCLITRISSVEASSIVAKRFTQSFLHNLREVCGDNVVYRSTVSRWSARFREGRLSTEDKPRSGRPSTAADYTSEVIVNDIL